MERDIKVVYLHLLTLGTDVPTPLITAYIIYLIIHSEGFCGGIQTSHSPNFQTRRVGSEQWTQALPTPCPTKQACLTEHILIQSKHNLPLYLS